jgi:hypothetical protein
MKNVNIFKSKILLICIIITSYKSYSQNISNGNFENNNLIIYLKYGIDPPVLPRSWCYYSSQNTYLTKLGENLIQPRVISPIEIRDSGIIIKNVLSEKDTILGYLTNSGQLPFSPKDGCPCYGPPDRIYKIILKYKYITHTNDSAYLRVLYTFNNVIHYDVELAIPKTNGTEYVTKTLWTRLLPVDSIPNGFVYYFRVSNPRKIVTPADSNELHLYNFKIDVSPACDNSFTYWKKTNYSSPTGWNSYRGFHLGYWQAFKGNGALALTSLQLENGTYQNYSERNFVTYLNGMELGGAPYSIKKDTLFGYYLFKGIGRQNAKVRLRLLKNNIILLDTFQTISVNGTQFQKFNLPFSIGAEPDTARIEIVSDSTALPGDTLILDEIQFASSPLNTTGSSENGPQKEFSFYPNPTNDYLYPSHPEELQYFTTIHILDITGKVVLQLPSNRTEWDLRELPAGMYLIKAEGSKGFYHKIVKE